jgi:hypothetical protein
MSGRWVAVMGGVGLRGVRLRIGRHQVSELTHVNDREIRVELANGSAEERDGAIKAWLDELLDIGGVREVDRE